MSAINTLRGCSIKELKEVRNGNYTACFTCYVLGALLCLTGVGFLFGFALFAVGQCAFGGKAVQAESEIKRRLAN